jgi:hypothetical protein
MGRVGFLGGRGWEEALGLVTGVGGVGPFGEGWDVVGTKPEMQPPVGGYVHPDIDVVFSIRARRAERVMPGGGGAAAAAGISSPPVKGLPAVLAQDLPWAALGGPSVPASAPAPPPPAPAATAPGAGADSLATALAGGPGAGKSLPGHAFGARPLSPSSVTAGLTSDSDADADADDGGFDSDVEEVLRQRKRWRGQDALPDYYW